jgi:putative endonuclease
MYTVYILYSISHKKSYTGFTSDLEQRLKSHNELATKGWTVNYRPWELVHMEVFEDKQAAMQHEKFLKSGQGRQQVQKLVQAWLERQHP